MMETPASYDHYFVLIVVGLHSLRNQICSGFWVVYFLFLELSPVMLDPFGRVTEL